MRAPKKTKNKFLFPVFLIQLAIAFAILFIFSTYVWGIQLKYDATKVGYERAFFYTLIVFGAGFSYDSAKKILFLEQGIFIPFAKSFGHSAFDIFIIIVLCAGTAFFLNIDYIIAGQLLYIGALGWVWFLVNSISEAIEVASK